MKIAPKILTGVLNSSNKGACDWGWQGMLAYGCQNLAVVVDPRSMQVIQVLDRHKAHVTKVKWARENYHHDLASPYTLRFASADNNGLIIVWDVAQASVRAEFSDGSRPIADLDWLPNQDASHDLLAALHPPYNLILWNAATGTKLWKKAYTEVLQGFSFDPFDSNKLAFIGQDCILFVDDFTVSKTPSSNGKKYYISTPSSQGGMSGSTSNEKLSDKKGTKTTITRRVSNILVGESSKRVQEDDSVALNECVQLTFHQACPHHLVLLYPREILILDLDINQTVGIIPMERSGSPFCQVIPLRQRDVMMCLHENGSVTVRVRRKTNQVAATPSVEQVGTFGSSEDSPTHTFLDVTYDLRCQSDPMRIAKNNRMFGMTCDPVGEMQVALLMSDSRILIWELKTIDYQVGLSSSQPGLSPLYTPGTDTAGLGMLGLGDDKLPSMPAPKSSLNDLISQTQTFVTESQAVTAQAAVPGRQNKHSVMLKFMLTGLLSGVATPPLVIRMCPPLTTKNWNVYQPLLALGTASGLIQVFNLSSGHLSRELSIHTCTVRGIEWVNLHSFLSHSYPSPGSNGLVKNELVLTDIQTGKSTPFRPNREEEPPIELLKVSYLKQYFVIVFKDKPFELWDLRSGTMLRQMPKNFPHVTALEWSPSHNLKSIKKRLNQEAAAGGGSTVPDVTTPGGATTPGAASAMEAMSRSGDSKQLSGVSAREHFVFTDNDGLLYHFIVEGNVIKDGSKIPPDGGMGSITCIAWKGETMVLGDVDGNLNLWDLKARVSRAVPTHRGWIRKIKFAPGRGNMKLLVLYNDGADIWDAKEVELVSAIKTPKDIPKLSDADWAGSDRPILACADSCVRVMDLKLRVGSSPVEEHQITEPVFSPHLVPPKAALTLKSLLQHQPWNTEYALELEETEENADIHRNVIEQLDIMDGDLKSYLPTCPFGTAQRCLLTARLFGDESELTFWTIALHYLRNEKADPMSKSMCLPRSMSQPMSLHGDLFIPTTPAKETHDLLVFDGKPTTSDGKPAPSGSADTPKVISAPQFAFVKDTPLETCFDILCDNITFQKYQLDRVSLHDSKRSTYEHTKKCAENLMYLGQTDRAVQLLLETEADNDNYYIDCLRACLVASIRSSGASQSTIKLVATNLIANGKLSEGVQLLCLIDKGLDACRYLQTYGAWYQAAWLAKATLDFSECCEVMKRWADHLCSPSVNQKSRAVLVLLSLGQFVKAIEMLYSLRQFDRAALFIESCQEFGLLDAGEETRVLVEAVFLEYARLLVNLGNRAAAQYYCTQAGDKGRQLSKEIHNMFSK